MMIFNSWIYMEGDSQEILPEDNFPIKNGYSYVKLPEGI